MNATMHSLSASEIACLVGAAQAHGVRTQARRSARAAKKAFDQAQSMLRGAESSARMFGHHDDCGSEYESEYKSAEGAFGSVKSIFEEAVLAEIEAEKAYTRAKYEAIARFPGLEPHITKLIASSNAKPATLAA